jgi:hypothetical protein
MSQPALGGTPGSTQLNGLPITSPSPAAFIAPSPAAPSPATMGAPSPAPATPNNPSTPSASSLGLLHTPQSGSSQLPAGLGQVRPGFTPIGVNGPVNGFNASAGPSSQLTNEQRGYLLAQAEQIRISNAKTAAQVRPSPSSIPTSASAVTQGRPPRPPSGPGRPPLNQETQRAAFRQSMEGYHKSIGSPLPPEVWDNGVKEGAFHVAGVWVNLMDLFLTIMRAGGITSVSWHPITLANQLIPVFRHKKTLHAGKTLRRVKTFRTRFQNPSRLCDHLKMTPRYHSNLLRTLRHT